MTTEHTGANEGSLRPPTGRARGLTPFRKLIMALAVAAVVRLTLVGNPWSWEVYGKVLEPTGIGWRQDSALRKRIERLDKGRRPST